MTTTATTTFSPTRSYGKPSIKAFTILAVLSILAFLPAAAQSQIVPTFAATGTVQAVGCLMVSEIPGEPHPQCTVTLTTRIAGQIINSPILCLGDMAQSCSVLANGDPAMIMGSDMWSYRLATHVGIEILNVSERNAPVFAQGNPGERLASSALARLGIGQAVTLSDGLTLRFVAVPEDDRCPIDVTCIQPGRAAVVVEAWQGESYSRAYLFEFSSGRSQTQRINGQDVTIVDLDPDPKEGQIIDPSDYSIVLKVHLTEG